MKHNYHKLCLIFKTAAKFNFTYKHSLPKYTSVNACESSKGKPSRQPCQKVLSAKMAIRGSVKCQAKKIGKKVNKIAGFVKKKGGDEFGKMVNLMKFFGKFFKNFC